MTQAQAVQAAWGSVKPLVAARYARPTPAPAPAPVKCRVELPIVSMLVLSVLFPPLILFFILWALIALVVNHDPHRC